MTTYAAARRPTADAATRRAARSNGRTKASRSDWLTYSARVQRVSDSPYWMDFPSQMPSLTQRLLPTDLSGTRRFLPFGDAGEIDAYARVQRFQTLQDPRARPTARR